MLLISFQNSVLIFKSDVGSEIVAWMVQNQKIQNTEFGDLRTSLCVKFNSWSIGDIYFWFRNLLPGQIHKTLVQKHQLQHRNLEMTLRSSQSLQNDWFPSVVAYMISEIKKYISIKFSKIHPRFSPDLGSEISARRY